VIFRLVLVGGLVNKFGVIKTAGGKKKEKKEKHFKCFFLHFVKT